jgi:molybdopterin synthase sulfur carrier subunit
MHITFKSFGPIRRVVGSKSIELDVREGSTVMNVIESVIDAVGAGLAHLIMDGKQVSGNLIVMLNKHDVDTLHGLETPVHDGDEVALLPHVQGG